MERRTNSTTSPVWFVFTDIEGSTARWDDSPEPMRAALAAHDRLIRIAFAEHSGTPVKHTGDGVLVVFDDAAAAVAGAVAAQQALATESFAEVGGLRVRMGVHGGAAQARDGDFFGPAVNRASRVMDAAHGGQILVSGEVVDVVGDALDAHGVEFEHLGVHRLKGLARPMVLHQVVHPELAREFQPLRSLNAALSNIAEPSRQLFGRDRELEALARLLDEPGLVTLLGPGGVGKTTLARHAAHAAGHRFPDGTWFCDFAAVRDPGRVPEVVASVLGVERVASQAMVDTLRDAMLTRSALIILDNCEHLTAAVAGLVRGVLVGSSALRFVATSRHPIGTSDERRLRVSPLALPATGSGPGDAVALFMERAAETGFPVPRSDANDRAVAQICEQLDGLPLAIELAAARTAVLHVDEIAARLGQRLRLLRNTSGDDERHHTLKATLDWSYELLDADEQRLFATLGCFAGGFDLEALVAVSELDEFDAVDLVEGLIAKSLVETTQSRGRRRLRLLETVREYAADLFADAKDHDAVVRRHAVYFADLVARAQVQLQSLDADDWVQRLYEDLANLRVAFHYWIAHDPPIAAAMPVSVWSLWTSRKLVDEGIRWLTDARDALDPWHPLAAEVNDDLASLAWTGGDIAQAEQSCLDAMERARLDGVEPRPTVLVRLAVLYSQSGRTQEARSLTEQALRLYRAGYAATDKVELLSALGGLLAATGDPARGAALCDEGLVIARAAAPSTLVSSLNNGAIAFSLHDPPKGVAASKEGLALARSIGSRYGEGNSLLQLGFAHQMNRDEAASRRAYAESLLPLRDSGQRGAVVTGFERLAAQLRDVAPLDAIFFRAAEARLSSELAGGDDELVRARFARTRARVSPKITDEAFEAAWARGLGMSLDDVVDEATTIVDDVESRLAAASEDGTDRTGSVVR